MVRARSDSNVVSIWFWIFAMIVMAIPLVNIVMTLVWAFTGENESRKNYFKAMIVLFLVGIGLMALLVSAGLVPVLLEKLRKLPVAAPTHSAPAKGLPGRGKPA